MSSAGTKQPAEAPQWHDARHQLPDGDITVRVIAHQEGTDYLEPFDAAIVSQDKHGRVIWRDDCGSLYAQYEIIVWRHLTEAESNT